MRVDHGAIRVQRRGFSVMEMVLVSILMSLLVYLIGQTWKAYALPAIHAEDRSRISVEACLAQQALLRDFSGALPELTISSGQTIPVDQQGRMIGKLVASYTSETTLKLYYDGDGDGVKGALETNDYRVTYEFVSSSRSLVRKYYPVGTLTEATTFTVATHVTAFTPSGGGDTSPVDMIIKFQFGDVLEREYHWIGVIPQ